MRRVMIALSMLLVATLPAAQADPASGSAAPQCSPWEITLGPDPTDIDVKVDPDHCIRDWAGDVLSGTPYCVHGSEPGCQALDELDQDVFDTAWGVLRDYGCILGSEPWCRP